MHPDFSQIPFGSRWCKAQDEGLSPNGVDPIAGPHPPGGTFSGGRRVPALHADPHWLSIRAIRFSDSNGKAGAHAAHAAHATWSHDSPFVLCSLAQIMPPPGFFRATIGRGNRYT